MKFDPELRTKGTGNTELTLNVTKSDLGLHVRLTTRHDSNL